MRSMLWAIVATCAVCQGAFYLRTSMPVACAESRTIWLEQVPIPSGLRFSEPTGGIRIALRGPKKVQIKQLRRVAFEVYILNASGKSLALSKHRYLVRLAFYDVKGQLATDLQDYSENEWARASIADLVVLEPGQMIRTLVIATSLRSRTLRKGIHQVQAILLRPPEGWWSTELRSLLKRDGVAVWEAARLASPRGAVELT
jgi:hypothetical protein